MGRETPWTMTKNANNKLSLLIPLLLAERIAAIADVLSCSTASAARLTLEVGIAEAERRARALVEGGAR
jgi:hypothetical protein